MRCMNAPYPSPIRGVEREVLGDLALPAITVGEQALLVIEEFFARLGGELEIRSLDDRVHWAGFLAQPAIDAFDHVDIVAGGAPGAVVAARAGLDGDRLRRANRLAQLAGNAALLAVGVAPQRVLAAETRRQRVLFERIVDGRLRLEEVLQAEPKGLQELPKEHRARGLIQSHLSNHSYRNPHPKESP